VLLVRSFALQRHGARAQAGFLLATGFAFAILALRLPAAESQIESPLTRLDDFASVFEFSERHSVHVDAPRVLVWDAVKSVTADEISFFRTLTFLRRLGQPGPESVLNAPGRLPILDVATRTSFLLLAEEPEHEVVVGTVVLAPRGTRFSGERTPQRFRALDAPGFAKATMNFLLEDAADDTCLLTTETRVHATDASARRRFAAYWRVIYPGSALIRRMWLRAIKLRAEAAR
jgi:hypothetical protein